MVDSILWVKHILLYKIYTFVLSAFDQGGHTAQKNVKIDRWINKENIEKLREILEKNMCNGG